MAGSPKALIDAIRAKAGYDSSITDDDIVALSYLHSDRFEKLARDPRTTVYINGAFHPGCPLECGRLFFEGYRLHGIDFLRLYGIKPEIFADSERAEIHASRFVCFISQKGGHDIYNFVFPKISTTFDYRAKTRNH